MCILNGSEIRRLRNEKGLTVPEVAPQVGASVSLVTQIEMGTKIPNANVLKAIADFFGVSVDSLFTRQPEAS